MHYIASEAGADHPDESSLFAYVIFSCSSCTASNLLFEFGLF